MVKRKTASDRRSEAVHLETRVRKTQCRKCGRPILTGWVWGEPVKLDRTHINASGEYAALLRGWKTYQESRFRPFRRRGTHIASPWPEYDWVIAEHRCGHRWDASHYDLRDMFPTYRGEDAPF